MTRRISFSRLFVVLAAFATLGGVTAACSSSTSSGSPAVTTVTSATTASTTTEPATTEPAAPTVPQNRSTTKTIDLQAFYDGCDDYTDLVTELRGTKPASTSNTPITAFSNQLEDEQVVSHTVACAYLFDGDSIDDPNRVQITATQIDHVDDTSLAVIWEVPGGDSTPVKGIGDEAAYTHAVSEGELQDSTQALIGNTVIRVSVYMPEDAPGADRIDQKSLTMALTTLLDTIGA